jgi:hypothetical protein
VIPSAAKAGDSALEALVDAAGGILAARGLHHAIERNELGHNDVSHGDLLFRWMVCRTIDHRRIEN